VVGHVFGHAARGLRLRTVAERRGSAVLSIRVSCGSESKPESSRRKKSLVKALCKLVSIAARVLRCGGAKRRSFATTLDHEPWHIQSI
jgi:hypothetical protein